MVDGMIVTKRIRRHAYRMLTKTLGHPAHTTEAERVAMKRLLDGWLGQFIKSDPTKRRVPWEVSHALSGPRTYYSQGDDRLLKFKWLDHRIGNACTAFIGHVATGRWRITPLVRIPRNMKGHNTVNDWTFFNVETKRQISIAISPLYKETVAKHGLHQDGRKIVQAIWDYRDYGDMEVWQCRYWDLTCLTNDEHSHTGAKQYEGYVAKTGTCIAVEQDFEKAVSVARRRTVQGVIRQVVKEYGDEKPE